jgi:pimeloyl-ACP methyl ester carboxylesterase
MQVIGTVQPGPEGPPATGLDPGYRPAPSGWADGTGRIDPVLRAAAQLRDGNAILRQAARHAYWNTLSTPGPRGAWQHIPPAMVTAIAQLAATGSNAYAAWSANPSGAPELTNFLAGLGMPTQQAQATAGQIMADFHAAEGAVRNLLAGATPAYQRTGFPNGGWIAVSAEDDPPDFPVNVAITQYPQFHVMLTVSGIPLSVRYVIASSRGIEIPAGAAANPSLNNPRIPPGDEVILYIHGEGSKAEEASDFIPALLEAAKEHGRSFTVLVIDQPGCGYTTSVIGGVHETVSHLDVAPMPPISGVSVNGNGIDTAPFGTSLLDFVQDTIIQFVETVVLAQGKTVAATVGGSLGGHMGLRLNAASPAWLNNVIAWSPASVWQSTTPLNLATGTANIPNAWVASPMAWYRAHQQEDPATSRSDFFSTVFDKDTANLKDVGVATAIASGLIGAGALGAGSTIPVLGTILAGVAVADVAGAIMGVPVIPPQPQMWYRDDWGPPGDPGALPCTPPSDAANCGQTKLVHICGGRLDRQEVYNENLRRWHWRICGECVGFSFDPLTAQIQKPLLLMVGDADRYQLVDFRTNVMLFGGTLTGPGTTQTINDTGHSIHNERPSFLAQQVLDFIPVVNRDPSYLFPLLLQDKPPREPANLSYLIPLLLSAP